MNWRLLNFTVLAGLSLGVWIYAAFALADGRMLRAGAFAAVGVAVTLRTLWQGSTLLHARPRVIYILAILSVAASALVIITASAALLVWVAILGRDGRYLLAAAVSVGLAAAIVYLVRGVVRALAGRKAQRPT
jgi:hypothetical protein